MRSTNCRGLWLIMVVLINLYIAPVTLAQGRPLMVNLAPYQTPIKNQGSRTTCITFASIAGLEAAYKHAGYGDLDLSEQFLNHTGKMFWLHPDWPAILAKGDDGSESQVGVFGGGGGAGYVRFLAHGRKVPEESVMGYHPNEYTAADHPYLEHAWNDPF